MVDKRDMFGHKERLSPLESSNEAWLPKATGAGPSAIEFRRKAQSWFSFPYSYLVAIEFAPGGTTALPDPHVAIFFSGHKVTIQGTNLGGIYEEIRLGRCQRVAEMDRSEVMALGQDAPVIERIEVEEV